MVHRVGPNWAAVNAPPKGRHCVKPQKSSPGGHPNQPPHPPTTGQTFHQADPPLPQVRGTTGNHAFILAEPDTEWYVSSVCVCVCVNLQDPQMRPSCQNICCSQNRKSLLTSGCQHTATPSERSGAESHRLAGGWASGASVAAGSAPYGKVPSGSVPST